MLGRFVREKYEKAPYNLVSRQVEALFDNSDYVIANLESPVTNEEETNALKFAGDSKLLEQFKWVDCFSISNNHINDFGEQGMTDTMRHLEEEFIGFNGLYEKEYSPITIEDGDNKIAVITCTDMLNYEFANNCRYKILRVDQPILTEIIKEYKSNNYFVILFAHVGSLFCRYPNPPIRDIMYGLIENGANCIITAHSHCLGGMDMYQGVPIFYNLGDFLMDGSSFRRRQSCVLNLEVDNNKLSRWSILPVKTTIDLQVVLPTEGERKKMNQSFETVSRNIQKYKDNYQDFYKFQYRKEMLFHSLSTLSFQYKTKGIKGLFRIFSLRFREIGTMADRMIFGRSTMRYDSDAVGNKIISKDKIR